MAKTCNKCEWSSIEGIELVCVNDKVIETNPIALSSTHPGVRCFSERQKLFLGACGKSGKLWRRKGEV